MTAAQRRLAVTLHATPRSQASLAQLVQHVHSRFGQTGVVYCDGHGAVRQVEGLFGALALPSVLALDIRQIRRIELPSVAYIFFLCLPDSPVRYVRGIEAVSNRTRYTRCEIFFPPASTSDDIGADPLSPMAQMASYCTTQRCRYAQIVRYVSQACPLPLPKQFSCGQCDVCLSQPRACYGDDVNQPWMDG
ncbi:RecQ family zinc-binding domain-containing protein [bacterium]|nr:RecQ family zinc-binding domain-containing protein [bacterium]